MLKTIPGSKVPFLGHMSLQWIEQSLILRNGLDLSEQELSDPET
ncbi:hypothetical protein [Paucibacter soli]